MKWVVVYGAGAFHKLAGGAATRSYQGPLVLEDAAIFLRPLFRNAISDPPDKSHHQYDLIGIYACSRLIQQQEFRPCCRGSGDLQAALQSGGKFFYFSAAEFSSLKIDSSLLQVEAVQGEFVNHPTLERIYKTGAEDIFLGSAGPGIPGGFWCSGPWRNKNDLAGSGDPGSGQGVAAGFGTDYCGNSLL